MIYKEILNNAQYVNTYCFNLTKCIERCLSINCIRKYAEHIRVRNSEKMPLNLSIQNSQLSFQGIVLLEQYFL